MITWGASISQRQPTCRPRFESQAHQLCFNHLKYLCHICNVKKTKRGRVWHNKKNRSLKTLLVTSMVQIRDSGGRDERLERKNSRNSASTKEIDRSTDRSDVLFKTFSLKFGQFFPLNVRLRPIDEMLYWGHDQEERVVELRLWGWG